MHKAFKKCKNCGNKFEPKTSLQTCCNIICTQEFTLRRKKLKIPTDKVKKCRECNKEFTINKINRSYCSIECSYKFSKAVKEKKRLQSKIKKPSVSKLKKEAWILFSKYIRTRDCLATTGNTEYGKCVTCDKTYPFNQLQASHFVDGRTKPVLFNEDIVYAGCMGCNVFKKGNKDAYTPFMIEKYGTEKVLEFLELRHNKDKVWTVEELEEVIQKYSIKLLALTGEK